MPPGLYVDSPSSSTSDLLLVTQPSSPMSPSLLDPDAPLPEPESRPPQPPRSPSPPPRSPPPTRARATRFYHLSSPSHIILLVAVIKFAATLLGMFIMLPTYRLLQDVFCHIRLGDDSPGVIDEKRCLEVDEVQADLAYFLAFIGLFHAAWVLLAAFPYGVLADTIGRKPTVIISYSALCAQTGVMYLFLWLLQPAVRRNPWILAPTTLLTLLGGGVHAIFGTLYAVAADVSTDATRADAFLKLTFGTTLGGTLGPALCGVLMNRYGPWFPFTITAIAGPFIVLLMLCLPETLPAKTKPSVSLQSWRSHINMASLRRHTSHAMSELLSSLRLLRSPGVLLTLATFLLQPILWGGFSTTLSLYVTRSFGWTLAQVGILMSPLSVLNLAILGGLPLLKKTPFLASSTASTFCLDLRLARISILSLAIGMAILALAPTFAIFFTGLMIGALGAAHSPLCRAVLTAQIPKAHTSRLYALISMAEIGGSVFGAPVLAWWFDVGMRKGGVWQGLPWAYISAWCVAVWACLMFVREESAVKEDDENSQRDEESRGERYRDDVDAREREMDGYSDMGVELGDVGTRAKDPLL